MARINLLPWRQAERERKNREFMTIVGAVLLLSLLAAFAAWSYFNNTLDSQKQANEKIKVENTKLDAALKQIDSLEKQRNEMLAQMKVIQDLQGRRPIPVRVWDDIARVIPPDMYLTNMNRTGELITFTGRAANNNVVSDFIRNLDASQWLEGSVLRSINQPQAVAYAQPKIATTNPNTPAGHPEDNYLIFVITTKIAATSPNSATASTSLSAPAITPRPVTSGVAPTAAPQATTASTAAKTAAPISSPSAAPTKAVATTTTSAKSTTTTTTRVSNDTQKPVASPTTANTATVASAHPTPASTVVATTNKERN